MSELLISFISFPDKLNIFIASLIFESVLLETIIIISLRLKSYKKQAELIIPLLYGFILKIHSRLLKFQILAFLSL